jgi:hypothetical protein
MARRILTETVVHIPSSYPGIHLKRVRKAKEDGN